MPKAKKIVKLTEPNIVNIYALLIMNQAKARDCGCGSDCDFNKLRKEETELIKNISSHIEPDDLVIIDRQLNEQISSMHTKTNPTQH